MRGKVMLPILPTISGRITPAYAGKRQAFYHRCGAPKDHPRLCGEKSTTGIRVNGSSGSPPPMRGKVSSSLPKSIGEGITPAYAGKSLYHRAKCSSDRDHPRLCGEKFRLHYVARDRWGSPPPMRGKVFQPSAVRRTAEDHPRLCGEKIQNHARLKPYPGSPPPMRGKVLR